MKKHVKNRPRGLSTGVSRFMLIAAAAVVVALTAGLVISFSRTKSNPATPAKPAAVEGTARNYITRKVGNQTVQIDPQTGQIRPLTPDEARRLAEGLKQMANQSTAGLNQVRHADGSVSVDLEGRFQ